MVRICAVTTSVMVHSEQVADLVGNDEGRGETVLTDQDAASRGIANAGDWGVAGWSPNIISGRVSQKVGWD